jgi:tRNA/tmRNA/rRNA uracil-C5-methylase (TrmA/RlmC/RlmD family)
VSVVGTWYPSSVPQTVRRELAAQAAQAHGAGSEAAIRAAEDTVAAYSRGVTVAYTGGGRQLQLSYELPDWPTRRRGASQPTRESPVPLSPPSPRRIVTLLPQRAFVQPNPGAAEQILVALTDACALIAGDRRASAAGTVGVSCAALAGAGAGAGVVGADSAIPVLWDLYCGGGLLGLALVRAGAAARVCGIELDADAVQAARANAALNGLSPDIASYHCADLAAVVPAAGDGSDTTEAAPAARATQLSSGRPAPGAPPRVISLPPPDAVVVDPPRAGLSAALLAQLRRVAPPHILYVSCNPASLARDVSSLCGWGAARGTQGAAQLPDTQHAGAGSTQPRDLGIHSAGASGGSDSMYELVSVQPVDAFPHAAHVETVALLRRINAERN